MASSIVLEVAGREVTVTHPEKMLFPDPGLTKLDLVRYYVAVADGALRGAAGRPMILKRFVKGIEEEAFFQKRAPTKRPTWIDTVELRYARGTSAEEVVLRDAASLAWVINLGCLDLNPHPVLAEDLDHPDELRIDLDPVPGVEWAQIVDVALVAREVLRDHGLVAWPKTSGSRGFHVYARIDPRWPYAQVRRAAETVAREVEARAPEIATSRWWKEERHGVFVDFNQNAKDRTVASAYSVRARPDARVSTPLAWDEVRECRPEEFTLRAVRERFADGDPWAGMDAPGSAGSLEALLELAKRMGPAERAPAGAPRGRAGRGSDGRVTGEAEGTGRRRSSMPLIEIARTRTRPEAMAALDRWKARHPDVADHLEPPDVLVDGMRGRSSVWYRVRVNLQHVPQDRRPEQEPLEADYDPWGGMSPPGPAVRRTGA